MKKFIKILSICLVALLITTGCMNKTKKVSSSTEVKGTLSELMPKLYEGISQENLPMGLGDVEVTKDLLEGFVGVADLEYESILASESMVGSIAHSVVLIRLKDNATKKEISDVVATIEENANPKKWICVQAETKYVINRGNLILLVMTDNAKAEQIKTNFNNL